jgi:predicted RNA binding protein YcfA (HicA-like mRNA interferase family)
MTRLPSISSKDLIRALRRAGFEDAPKRGKGSHMALIKRTSGITRLVIVPDRKTLPKDTLRAILDQAGLSREEFLLYFWVRVFLAQCGYHFTLVADGCAAAGL